jgi:hypothetical protein
MKKKDLFAVLSFVLLCSTITFAQVSDSVRLSNNTLDSLYIVEVQDKYETDKVLHAEPLYIDLIRDLGARKGEREWNAGLGLTDKGNYNEYEALIEYEWAPIDRLGLEIELPFALFYPISGISPDSIPRSSLNSLKLGTQYSFFVSEKYKTSMAIGYLHEFELVPFVDYTRASVYKGNLFNPFFVIAKRFGQNFHSLIYTGPQFIKEFKQAATISRFEINTNLHYMIGGTRNFIGLEFNKELFDGQFDMTIRPQMRLEITDHLLIGIVTGIPIRRQTDRFSTFLRLIYEPPH